MSIKFVWLVKPMTQLGFGGMQRVEEIFHGDVHIEVKGSILCGTDRAKLLKAEGVRVKSGKTRPHSNVCQACQKAYKVNGQLDWYKWERNVKQT